MCLDIWVLNILIVLIYYKFIKSKAYYLGSMKAIEKIIN